MSSYHHNPYRQSSAAYTPSQQPRQPPPPPPQLASTGAQSADEEAEDGDESGGDDVARPRHSAELTRESRVGTAAMMEDGGASHRTRPTPLSAPYTGPGAPLSLVSALERLPNVPQLTAADARAGAQTAHRSHSSEAAPRVSGTLPPRPSPSAPGPPSRGGRPAAEADVHAAAADDLFAYARQGGDGNRSWPQLAPPPAAHSYGTPPIAPAHLPPSLAVSASVELATPSAAGAVVAAVRSAVEALATTLFVDGLPAAIANQWQLRPFVPPHGLTFVRVKSSRGRNVGFAVYESLATARDAHAWFKQMRIIQEVVVASTYGAAPAAASRAGAVGVDGMPDAELLPLAYEDYVHTQQSPAQFAALLRTCALLHVEWARSVETQHGSPSLSATSSSPPSIPASPWGSPGAVQAPPTASASSSAGRPPSSLGAPPPPLPPPPPPPPPPHFTALAPPRPPARIAVSAPTTPHATAPPHALYHHVPTSTGTFARPAPGRRGASARRVHSGDAPATRQTAAHHPSSVAERAEEWWGAVSPVGERVLRHPPQTAAPALRLESGSPAASHAYHRHHRTPQEPPLPCRTLFVKLIHNFDAPEYMRQAESDPSTTPPPTAQSAPTTPSLNPPLLWSPPQPATPGGGSAAATAPAALPTFRPLSAVVAHHHHHHHLVLHHTAPPSGHGSTLEASGSTAEDRREFTTPLTPPSVVHPRGHGGLAEGPTSVAAQGAAGDAGPTAEDKAFFHLAQSVLQEAYFSERFAGFQHFRGFLRPPFYGGCFVRFERGEDMQRCLQWMRRDERLMQIFSVAPARSDSFGA